MNKLNVYFKEFKVGELFFENNIYSYFHNEHNIKKAKEKGYPIFLYDIEKSFQSNSLPQSFLDMLPAKENINLKILTGISDSDEDFVKLCKLAAADLSRRNFYVSFN